MVPRTAETGGNRAPHLQLAIAPNPAGTRGILRHFQRSTRKSGERETSHPHTPRQSDMHPIPPYRYCLERGVGQGGSNNVRTGSFQRIQEALLLGTRGTQEI